MIELFLSLCMSSGGQDCRDVYIPSPGYATMEECKPAADALQGKYTDAAGSFVYCGKLPEPWFVFDEIADGVYAHQGIVADAAEGTLGDLSNVGFIIGDKAVLVVDSSGSYEVGSNVYYAIRQHTDLPITTVVLTHMHPDHIYGASVLEGLGAQILAHPNMPEALASRAESYQENYEKLLGKDVTLDSLPAEITPVAAEGQTIDLGNRLVHIQPWSTAHTNNDASVFDIKTGTLYTGDLLFDRHTPVLDGSIRGWVEVIAEMEKLADVKQLVPGHGEKILDFPNGFDNQMRYLNVLINDAKSAIDKGERMNDAVKTIGQSERDKWELFESFNPRNATTAFSELEWE